MTDTVAFAFSMATLGQIVLCVTILATRVRSSQVYLPLILFFLCNAIVAAAPSVWTLFPDARLHYVTLLPPAYLLLAPALWLYVSGLTSENVWRLASSHKAHFIPFVLGLAASSMILALPNETSHALFIGRAAEDMLISKEGKLLFAGYLAFYLFILVIGWGLQSGFYVFKIFRHLPKYRAQLKQVFASIEERELRWITGILFVIGGTWLLTFTDLLAGNIWDYKLLSIRTLSFLELILVFTVAFWGLRQKPGFEGSYQDPASSVQNNGKYSKSALGEEQAKRIIKKIEKGVSKDALYLEPNISLQILAKHIGVSSNHISQTLNEAMGTNFFDYVNKHRIEAAKPLVQEGSETILSIAYKVGFNARSSFYRAFKHHTGQTPSEFRNSNS